LGGLCWVGAEQSNALESFERGATEVVLS